MEDHDFPVPAEYTDPKQAPARIAEMFVNVGQARRIENGQIPAERAVFRKLHGVAHGELMMRPDMPEVFRQGIFRHERLKAWMRFSSDAQPTDPDLHTTLGIGLKLFGVDGVKANGEASDTADFIMQNCPVFFVPNAVEMSKFTYAGVVQGNYDNYLDKHPETRKILRRMSRQVEGSVLTATYWAILPFKAGMEFVKYRLVPDARPTHVPCDEADYLAVDLCRRLRHEGCTFRLMAQRRTVPEAMPLDDATVEWPESLSPFEHVATLVIPAQDVAARGQAEYGQNLAFSIWNVPAEQAPEGSIAQARRLAYPASTHARRQANGQPDEEPRAPRAAGPGPQPDDDVIVKAVIHPAIGVARVGGSEDYFVGPEVPDPPPADPGFYRDAHKRLKRQAARFRVYGVNAMGRIVKELGPDQADVTWQVELANLKSAWYEFQMALDIPEAATADPSALRNADVADREKLRIRPGPRRVKGRKSSPARFDTGRFMEREVYLGEILTDDEGRLVVLGGHGHSASYNGTRAVTFGNNETWHDDVADGPVTAEVVYQGRALMVTPAWVVVAPPNYAPQRKSVRTLWDLMRDLAIANGALPRPQAPSFTFDILPIFERLAGLQWVNAGFASGFGWQGMVDLHSREALARLSKADPAYLELRKSIANQFRDVAIDGASPKPWPWLYGDAMTIPATDSPRMYAALTPTQSWMLQQWAAGNFVEDYDAERRPPARIEDVPLAQQGDTLTRAALEFCLADAFHPGCELTWPVRHWSMYQAPFRFAHAHPGRREAPLGEVLTASDLDLPEGPLGAQHAGGLTRWMAVPWQTDTASCRSGYDKRYDPYVPSFWPARVPNQVLTWENYKVVMDESRPQDERLAAFANRAAWIEPLGTQGYTDQINRMIRHFDAMGVVEARPGPQHDPRFPAVMEVEDQHPVIPDDEQRHEEHRARPAHGLTQPERKSHRTGMHWREQP